LICQSLAIKVPELFFQFDLKLVFVVREIDYFLDIYYPHPSLPPRGKEYLIRLFPLGGNGKGGQFYYLEICIVRQILVCFL
jgi:hypothetical protein